VILRPYQLNYIAECSKAFKENNKRIVLAAPTGAGKTAMFSEIVKRSAERGTSVLIITDRIELFKQTYKALQRINIVPQLISAKTKDIEPNALISIAMVETLTRRINKGLELNPKLIVIDEAHMGNFTKIFKHYPNAYVIGATATPVGKHFFIYYDKIVQCIDVPELVAEGYLARCKGYEMRDNFDDLKVNAGEYTSESLFNHFDNRKLYDGVVNEWEKKCLHKKTIVFCVNIEHTEKTCQAFIDAGYKADFVTSKTSDEERKNILAKFSNGEIDILCNCGILTKGYDEPSIECVIMNRKTLSLPLWLQCAGRGSRTTPTKNEFYLLDFGQNFSTHGLWNESREWKLEKEKKKGEGAAPVKSCDKCGAINAARATECEVCEEPFESKGVKLESGVMVEVVAEDELKGRTLSSLNINELALITTLKPTYIWRIVRSKGIEAIEQFAKIKNYKKGWIYQQKLLLDDTSFYDKQI
jgi:superfamily II DNA or RNA helicase